MLPLAHLGIGSAMARPFLGKLPFRWLLVGTLLPDLIDKPAFLVLGLVEYFRNGGWIPGKRGIAHTALFLCPLAGISIWRKSPSWSAATLGTATHLILDVVSKMFGSHHTASGSLVVLFWPFLGWRFPTLSYGAHGIVAIMLEGIGVAFLVVQLAVKRLRPSVI
jgi:LexA-binding, inner membrane-associated putative hydrolase